MLASRLGGTAAHIAHPSWKSLPSVAWQRLKMLIVYSQHSTVWLAQSQIR